MQCDLADAWSKGTTLQKHCPWKQTQAQDLLATQNFSASVNLKTQFKKNRGVVQIQSLGNNIRPLNVIIKAGYTNNDGRKVDTLQLKCFST